MKTTPLSEDQKAILAAAVDLFLMACNGVDDEHMRAIQKGEDPMNASDLTKLAMQRAVTLAIDLADEVRHQTKY